VRCFRVHIREYQVSCLHSICGIASKIESYILVRELLLAVGMGEQGMRSAD
jgi:hypothetical protein